PGDGDGGIGKVTYQNIKVRFVRPQSGQGYPIQISLPEGSGNDFQNSDMQFINIDADVRNSNAITHGHINIKDSTFNVDSPDRRVFRQEDCSRVNLVNISVNYQGQPGGNLGCNQTSSIPTNSLFSAKPTPDPFSVSM